MADFVDLHAHWLYGVDDGPKTPEEMFQMLEAAWEDGVRVLMATPHASPGLKPFPGEEVRLHIEEARRYCREQGYDMTLLSGAEILWNPALPPQMDRLTTLEDSDALLVEFLPDTPWPELREALQSLRRVGYRVLLAHAERYRCLRFPGRMAQVKEMDVYTQINCGPLLKGRSRVQTWWMRRWIRGGMVDCVASDAHDIRRRSTRMREAYEELKARFGEETAEQLTGGGDFLQSITNRKGGIPRAGP